MAKLQCPPCKGGNAFRHTRRRALSPAFPGSCSEIIPLPDLICGKKKSLSNRFVAIRASVRRRKSMNAFARVARGIAFVAALCLFAVSALWSQTATGRIVGTVTDPTGAVIPGASITVTNADTRINYEALTNEQGAYQAPLLPIGTYTVAADVPGFQKAVTKPEKLEINQSLRVDIKLAVGARTEEIVVEEGITHVETISPTLGMSVTSNQMVN